MTAQSLDAPRGFYPKAERDKLLARIDALETELAELRALKAEAIDAAQLAAVCHAGFTRGQGKLLLALYASPVAQPNLSLARRAGVGTLWDRYGHHDDEAAIGALKCQVHWVRRRWAKLGGPDNPIHTVNRVGYALSPEGRQWLAGLLEAIPQPADPEHAPTASQSPAKGNLKRGGAP